MFELPRRRSGPTLDLSTVCETLAYIHDDIARAPGLGRAAAALAAALAELEVVERAAGVAQRRHGAVTRFLPMRARP